MRKYLIILLLFVFGFSMEVGAQKKANDATPIVADSLEVSGIFIDAVKARVLNDIPKAVKLFESCLEKNPRHAPSMYELSQLYVANNDFATAQTFTEKALQIEPGNKWYKLQLADIYKRTQNAKGLLELTKQMAKDEPGNVDYLYELANSYLLDGDGGNAIKTYEKIEEIIGVSEEISLQKYKVLLVQRKTDQAIAEIEKLIMAFPDQKTRYLSMIAEMYNQTGKPDDAEKYYKRIKEAAPDDPYVHISLSDYYRKKGDIDNALKELKLGFANPALDIETKIRVMQTYFANNKDVNDHLKDITELAGILAQTHPEDTRVHAVYGDFLAAEKRYAEARTEILKSMAIDSSRYASWETLLNTEIQLGDFQALYNESARAIELFPLQPVPHLFKGLAFIQQKKYSEAIDALNKGVKLVYNNDFLLGQFYSSLGDSYNGLGNFKLSDENYDKALKVNPDNSYVLNNYAYYLSLRNEQLEKALQMAERSVKLDPENAANMDTYGWVLYKKGNYAEALKWVEKAISSKGQGDGDLLDHLGDIHYKLGNNEKAVECWQKALKAGGTSENLKKKIAEKKLYE